MKQHIITLPREMYCFLRIPHLRRGQSSLPTQERSEVPLLLSPFVCVDSRLSLWSRCLHNQQPGFAQPVLRRESHSLHNTRLEKMKAIIVRYRVEAMERTTPPPAPRLSRLSLAVGQRRQSSVEASPRSGKRPCSPDKYQWKHRVYGTGERVDCRPISILLA